VNNYILKIDCTDSKGLIYKISDVLYKSDLNIVKNDEFVDSENSKFFFRAIVNGGVEKNNLIKKLKDSMPHDANIELMQRRRKKIVIMATKESHCLGDLLLKEYSDDLNAEVVAVVSNYDYLKELVDKFNIPYHFVCHQGLSRDEHEKKVIEVLQNYE